MVDLSEDAKWRVRLAIIEFVPRLAEQLGKPFFNEKLSELSLNWLADDVYTVRRAAAENVRKLVDSFGEEWALQSVLPRIETLSGDKSYLRRTTSLYALQMLMKSPAMSAKCLKSSIMPVIIAMEKDSVPNVRFTVARTLAQMYTRLHSDTRGGSASSEDWEADPSSLKSLMFENRPCL